VNKKYTIGFDGEAVIKRSEFGVNYGLPFVGDEVTLKLEAEFIAQPAG
jgi:polyisoprenoid-binding protein YceI